MGLQLVDQCVIFAGGNRSDVASSDAKYLVWIMKRNGFPSLSLDIFRFYSHSAMKLLGAGISLLNLAGASSARLDASKWCRNVWRADEELRAEYQRQLWSVR